MRMVYVGTLDTTPDRDSGWIDAFRNLGIDVSTYSSRPADRLRGWPGRLAERLHIGPLYRRMQRDLVELVRREKPDWIHFRLPVEFDRGTIRELRRLGIVLTQYFNDDPFSRMAPAGFHWKFRHALPGYDAHFVFRPRNVEQYRKAGANHCGALPAELRSETAFHPAAVACPGRLPRRRRVHRTLGKRWAGRLSRRARARGLRPHTERRRLGPRNTGACHRKTDARNACVWRDYNRIYAGVVAGLCFFSKINNDSWTRRALEIVAVGGLLVCERTEEAQTYFKDREEAFFFSSVGELVDIVQELKAQPSLRENARSAGYRRLLLGRNTIDDRAAQVLGYVTSLNRVSPA